MVFCQNGASSSKLNDSAYLIQYADPGVENIGKSKTMEKMSTMQNVTMEGIEKTQHLRKTDNLQNGNVIQRQNLFTKNVQSTVRASTNVVSAARRELVDLSRDACNEIPEDVSRTRITGDHQEFVKGDNLEGSLNDTNNMNEYVMKSIGQELEGTNAVQMQSQPPKSKASLPQWTDEQLDELFAGDDVDGSLF